MNIKKNIKILSITVLLCLSVKVMWSLQKNSTTASSTDIKHLPIETEYMANSKQIRKIMISIAEHEKVSRSVLQKLKIALDRNQMFFKESEAHQNLHEFLFGKGNDQFNDYDLFYKVRDVLFLNVNEKFDTNSFAAAVQLPGLFRDALSNNVELSEYLDELVIDFSIAAPLTMVKYLDKCSKDEFDLVFRELSMYLYEIPGKREELDSELAKISTKEKKYVKTIEKIRRRINEGVEYCGFQNCID